MANNSFQKISEKSQALLISYLEICYQRFEIDTARVRYERVDKAIQLEDTSRRKKIEHYYDDIVMPVVKSPVRKIGNFLIDIFVSEPSIFEATSSNPANAGGVKQMNAVIEENAKTSKWSRELVLFFKDLPKYNVGGIACEWMESEVTTVATSADVASTASTIATSTRAGNVLKRLDPYNMFYDTAVPVSRVADEGDYIGWNEQYSNTRLAKYISDVKISLGITSLMNEDKIFASNAQGTARHYRPQINTKDSTVKDLSPMQMLFQGHGGTVDMTTLQGSNKKLVDPTGANEIQTLFVRIIPRMFGIKVPDSDKVQLWKLTVVNWTVLIVAEKLANAHSTFPALLCQIDEEGIDDQVKSAAEILLPMQNLNTKLYDARMQGLHRNVNDRALYNSSRIDKKHMSSDNPSAKIPVKPNILNPGLENAYKQIPFQDNLGTTILQELGFLNQVAQRTSGLNDPQQGMFQKGNKTLGEFNEVMQNADDDLRTWAKLVEAQVMMQLKYLVKTNILQFQTSTSITPTGAEEAVEINPNELRQAAMEFKLADGLISKESLMDLPTARGFFELLLQSPQLQQFYGEKLPELVDYIFSTVGFDTSKFKGQNAGALAPPATPPTEGQA